MSELDLIREELRRLGAVQADQNRVLTDHLVSCGKAQERTAAILEVVGANIAVMKKIGSWILALFVTTTASVVVLLIQTIVHQTVSGGHWPG